MSLEPREMSVHLTGTFAVSPGNEDWFANELGWLIDERSRLLGYTAEGTATATASTAFHQWGSWKAGSDWDASADGICHNVWNRVGVERSLLEARLAPIASVLDVTEQVLNRLCGASIAGVRGLDSETPVEIDSVAVRLPAAPELELARLVHGADLSASWLAMATGQPPTRVELSASGDVVVENSPSEVTAALGSRWYFLREMLSLEPIVETVADRGEVPAAVPRVYWRVSVPEWSATSIAWLLMNMSAVLRSMGAGVDGPGMTVSARRITAG